MYLITHSLLSAWLYAMQDNPYADSTTEKDYYQDFLRILRKEPGEQTEAMQTGIEFENLVTDIVNGDGDTEHKWYEAACKVASAIKGGWLQYKAKKEITVSGIKILLYGRLDVLKAGTIIDVKFSKSYDRGKYIDSTQHPAYMELIPEAGEFTYIVSNGSEVWTETYRRDETPDIIPIIEAFLAYLQENDLWEVFTSFWAAR